MKSRDILPLKGRRYLDKEIVEFMLSMAVKPHRLRICKHDCATHAAACSAGGLIAHAMRTNLNFLRDQVDICWMELMHERDFGLEKLQEHIDILGSLNLLLFTITADRISAFSEGLSDEICEAENVMTHAFAMLPQKHLRPYNKGIIRLRYILEEKILVPMMTLRDRISEDQEKDWQEDIRCLLHMRIGKQLVKMFEDLVQLSKRAGSVVESIRGDFKADLDQIEADGHLSAPSGI